MIETLTEITKSLSTATECLKTDTSKELDLTKKKIKSENSIDYSKKIDISRKKVKKYEHIPRDSNRSYWVGTEGDSVCIPKDISENKIINDFLHSKEINGIEYKNGYPDFSPIAEETVQILDMTNVRSGKRADGKQNNYGQACTALAQKWNSIEKNGRNDWTPQDIEKWSSNKGLTIHECPDLRTCQFVNFEIHDFFKHPGGVSEYKKKELNKIIWSQFL